MLFFANSRKGSSLAGSLRGVWPQILNNICSSNMLRRVEVQDHEPLQEETTAPETRSPPPKRQRSWHRKPLASVPSPVESPTPEKSEGRCAVATAVPSRMIDNPSPDRSLGLVSRPRTGTKSFPKFGVKAVEMLPDSELKDLLKRELGRRTLARGGKPDE